MTEEKKLFNDAQAELKQIDEVNHQIYCVNAIIDLMHKAIDCDCEHAREYASAVHVCNWALEDVMSNLDRIYEESLQALRQYEQDNATV